MPIHQLQILTYLKSLFSFPSLLPQSIVSYQHHSNTVHLPQFCCPADNASHCFQKHPDWDLAPPHLSAHISYTQIPHANMSVTSNSLRFPESTMHSQSSELLPMLAPILRLLLLILLSRLGWEVTSSRKPFLTAFGLLWESAVPTVWPDEGVGRTGQRPCTEH